MDPEYISEANRSVELPSANEFRPIPIGPLQVWPPVVLAPMAGVTNWPFRALCREYGAGLYVSEMITARPLVENRAKTLKLTDFGTDESPRSLQLYGVDPHYVGEAVARLVNEGRVDHIDMNFGCPVPKVTSKGGGAALPLKPKLLASIVRAAVQRAGSVPVTIKFRMGIDDQHLTYLDAGRVGEEEGCRAIALHARTAAQLYDGTARWDAIATLKQHVTSIPVLGNGDIWECFDALRMMRTTGCDGVVVGRGCLGRPWLFRDLAEMFSGKQPSNPPTFGKIVEIMLRHASLLTEWMGETHAMRMFRRHASWYTKGFHGAAKLRRDLMQITQTSELEVILGRADLSEPFPPSAMRVPRGKTSGVQRVSLPPGFLEGDNVVIPEEAESAVSGG